jgi:predicted cupin superfamily sugar epimerase
MAEKSISPLVEKFNLRPHVEGGWFRESWRTSVDIPQSALGPQYSGIRQAASAVYFLLHPGEVSQWHKVLSDELWLWHHGGPLKLTLGGSGDQPGVESTIPVSMDVDQGHIPQALVPAGVWQKAEPLGDEPVFVTCIVAPAFEFDDFTMISG